MPPSARLPGRAVAVTFTRQRERRDGSPAAPRDHGTSGLTPPRQMALPVHWLRAVDGVSLSLGRRRRSASSASRGPGDDARPDHPPPRGADGGPDLPRWPGGSRGSRRRRSGRLRRRMQIVFQTLRLADPPTAGRRDRRTAPRRSRRSGRSARMVGDLLDRVGCPGRGTPVPARVLGRSAPARRRRASPRAPAGPGRRRRDHLGLDVTVKLRVLALLRSSRPSSGWPTCSSPTTSRSSGRFRSGCRHVPRRDRGGGPTDAPLRAAPPPYTQVPPRRAAAARPHVSGRPPVLPGDPRVP